MSLAEIEEKIRTMGPSFGRYGDRAFMRMLDSVDVADMPQLLAFIDKNAPQNVRQGLRYTLISRWAELDSSAALAYAQSIPNRQERDSAIGAFVSGWAGKDPRMTAD